MYDSWSSYCVVLISSLEETYEALKTFKVLGIEKKHDIRTSSCASVADTLKSTSSALKDLVDALRVNSILKCGINSEAVRVLKIFMPSATLYVKSCSARYFSYSSPLCA